ASLLYPGYFLEGKDSPHGAVLPSMAEALRTLIETARKGDRQALNSLAGCVDRFVRIHSGALSNHLRKTYGSTVDFVLEGLAEALARLPEFEYRSDEQFYSWVS